MKTILLTLWNCCRCFFRLYTCGSVIHLDSSEYKIILVRFESFYIIKKKFKINPRLACMHFFRLSLYKISYPIDCLRLIL